MFQFQIRMKSALKKFSVAVCVVAGALTATQSPALANDKYAGIVIDANTGKTLYDYRGDSIRFPASLTKMMTAYMMFDAMRAGKLNKNTPIRVSNHAASMVPSKLGVRPGGSLTAEQAIYALVTKSANDVAAAVAEHLGGTESNFAKMMTAKARSLGMSKTVFRNASGLPDSKQVTTARDMARLGIALQEHFPREFAYFKTREFKFGKSRFSNHNRLLGTVRGVDGIKTGYTRASGFNLVSSVNTGGRSIVAVVLGGRTGASRNAQMQKLIGEYLPKASKKDGGPLIARGNSPQFGSPVVASIADVPLKELPVPGSAPTRDDETNVAAAYVPEPTANPKTAIDPLVTASTAPTSGWIIQIASLPSEAEAREYLSTAQSRAQSVVGNRKPFVEVFTKGSTTYHRARFAGFDSKSQARAACKAIKRYNYDCLAQQL
ncbi:MAG: D-alanyl-D-alanine carboxypeptidase family protein [Ahrensia sp.]